MEKCQILLTNDDGIQSPGLWAAAEALSDLGYVTVAAPRDQSSGMGRSLPSTSDGVIRSQVLNVRGKDWTVYSVGGSPAQAVLHGMLEIMPHKPDLVVSGINYGENVATGITISGTVGAALEAAGMGVRSLAMSLETGVEHHHSYSREIDFSAAAYFTAFFARLLLEKTMPPDVDLLKVDVPSDATPRTPWQVTRLAHQHYFTPIPPERSSWDQPGRVSYRLNADLDCEPDSDVYALRVKRQVSVTPLSLDMTSRAILPELEALLRGTG
ncbi:MAG: 5'/3'-nucleotidase SurE [Chloroflexi bacterium]|nr:5'/3'-nucleotidase SurE [Chloroflexota bacterium]